MNSKHYSKLNNTKYLSSEICLTRNIGTLIAESCSESVTQFHGKNLLSLILNVNMSDIEIFSLKDEKMSFSIALLSVTLQTGKMIILLVFAYVLNI